MRLHYSAYVAALLVGGCRGDLAAPLPFDPALDEAYFRCRVQPVLTKDCSMFACHGDGRRYFRVYARNRLRYQLSGEAQRNALMTLAERTANFDAARAFVDENSPSDSLLLKKPLAQSAGGYFHRGETIYNRGNVFLTRDDPEYKALAAWIVDGAKEDPNCVEPGSDQ